MNNVVHEFGSMSYITKAICIWIFNKKPMEDSTHDLKYKISYYSKLLACAFALT